MEQKKENRGKLFLSLVIPAYNAEATISHTVKTVLDFLKDKKYLSEVIIVDDGSKDKTASIGEKFAVTYPNVKIIRNSTNKGKGYSVKRGVLSAQGKYAIFTDADLPYALEDTEKFLYWLSHGYDIVIGSRRLPASEVRKTPAIHRKIMGRIFSTIVGILTSRGFADTQCGFKGFKRETTQFIFEKQRIDRFAFDIELLYLARKYKLSIKELPVKLTSSQFSTVKLLLDPLNMLRDVFKIRLNDWLGRYK